MQEGSLQTLSGTVTPMGGVTSTAASSEIGELTSGMVDHSQLYGQQAAYRQYDQQQGDLFKVCYLEILAFEPNSRISRTPNFDKSYKPNRVSEKYRFSTVVYRINRNSHISPTLYRHVWYQVKAESDSRTVIQRLISGYYKTSL